MGKQGRRANRAARKYSFRESLLGQAIDHLDVVTDRVRSSGFAVYDYIGTDTVKEFETKAAEVDPVVKQDVALLAARLKVTSIEIAALLHGVSSRYLLSFFQENQRQIDGIRYRQRLLIAETATKQLAALDTIADPTGTIYRGNMPNLRFKTVSLEDLNPDSDGTFGQEIFTYFGNEPLTVTPNTHLQMIHEHGRNNFDFDGAFQRLLHEGRLADVIVDRGVDLEGNTNVQERFNAIMDDRKFAVDSGMTIVDPLGMHEFSTRIANTFGVEA